IENPSMIDANGDHWLVYSGAYWATSRYAMGFAHCGGPLGPCTDDSTRRPWLASQGGVVGPGGGAVFGGPDGVLRLVYHAWSGGVGYSSGGRRVLYIETIGVNSNGPTIIDRPPEGGLAPAVIGPTGVTVSGLVTDPDTIGATQAIVYLDGADAGSFAAAPGFSLQLA